MKRPNPMVPTAMLTIVVLLTGCQAAAPSPAAPASVAAEVSTASPPAGAETAAAPAPSIDLTAFSASDPASPWVVVNKAHPLEPADYAPDDLVVVHGYYVRSIAADDLAALLDAAAADGVTLTLRSTYRSYDKQRDVYDGLVAQDGRARADRISARPAYSEHQTGLAIDVGSSTDSACDFEDCFASTPEGLWVAANAQRFGFIVRYTSDDEAVTGYAAEPWHLRHVGRALADAMAAAGVTTLEQVFDVDGGPDYEQGRQ